LVDSVLGIKLQGLEAVALETLCRFFAPAYPGDTITAIVEVSEKMADKKRVRLKLT